MYFIYDNDPEVGKTNFIPCITPEDGDFFFTLSQLLSESSVGHDIFDSDTYDTHMLDILNRARQQYQLSPFWTRWFDNADKQVLLSMLFTISCYYKGEKDVPLEKGDMLRHSETNNIYMYISDSIDGTIHLLQLTHMGLNNTWEPTTLNPLDLMAMANITLPIDKEQVLLFHEPLFHTITHTECDIL